METYGLSVKQFQAWRAFHKLRGLLLPHLAKGLNENTGISQAEFFVLITLLDSPSGALNSSELAEKLDWEKSRVSHQLSRMEERGLLARSTGQEDARSCVAEITPSGRKSMEKALPSHFEDVKHCFAGLLTSAQLELLIEISKVVSIHLQEEHSVPVKGLCLKKPINRSTKSR